MAFPARAWISSMSLKAFDLYIVGQILAFNPFYGQIIQSIIADRMWDSYEARLNVPFTVFIRRPGQAELQ
jgi:hypothetical protein